MGQSLSSRGHMNLTLRQMDIILLAGQQPGVPFRLGASGAQRPQGKRVKVNYVENLVSMQKGSVCVEESEDRKSVGTGKKGSSKRDLYSLGFTYDSLVPAVVRIFVGASDRTVPHQIRAENAVLILGPYKLEVGNNRRWSSSYEDGFIDGKYVTGRGSRKSAKNQPDLFDFMVCLAPLEMVSRCDLFSIPPGVQTRNQPEGLMWLSDKMQSEQWNDQGQSLPFCASGLSQADGDRPSSASGSRSPGSYGQSKSGSNRKNGSSSNMDIDSQCKEPGKDQSQSGNAFNSDAERTLQSKSKKKPANADLQPPGRGEVDSHRAQFPPPHIQQRAHASCAPTSSSDVFLGQDHGKGVSVICEVSYVRVVPPKVVEKEPASAQITESSDGTSTPSPTSRIVSVRRDDVGRAPVVLKCLMQRVQMGGSVFLTQDIYGMDRNCEEEHDPTADETPAGGDAAVPAAAPGGITLDSDAIECVICLTDPRVIAVYPCRHMCLCSSCAEVLPSQGNKCPICRRPASMLLKISPKEVSEGSL